MQPQRCTWPMRAMHEFALAVRHAWSTQHEPNQACTPPPDRRPPVGRRHMHAATHVPYSQPLPRANLMRGTNLVKDNARRHGSIGPVAHLGTLLSTASAVAKQ